MKIILKILSAIFAISFVESTVIRLKDQNNIVVGEFKIIPWKPYSYHFEYSTATGIARKETGFLKKAPNGINILKVVGFYRFKTSNNKTHHVDYTADENGFHPSINVKNSDDPKDNYKDKIYFPEDKISTPSYSNTDLTTSDETVHKSDPKTLDTILKDTEGVGNRFDLPPGLIGSLLG